MRRKRRQRFTWMPTLGTAPGEGAALGSTLSGKRFFIDVFPGIGNVQGSINTLIFPVIPDAPEDNEDAQVGQGQLVQLVGNEWFLERLVGKLFLTLRVLGTETNNALVGAGFFVARANDEQSGGGVEQPLGSASLAERNSNYSPLGLDTIREPWLWRRVWALGGPAAGLDPFSFMPVTNSFYGSVSDGPHIDAKSVRRIGQDDRLWFAVSTAQAQNNTVGTTTGRVEGYLDLRVLGALRKARNDGKF